MNTLNLLENKKTSDNISILPIPINIGSDNPDTKNAPDYLLKIGLKNSLETNGFKVNVLPSIKISQNKNTKDSLSLVQEMLTKTSGIIAREILSKRKIITLGGDHTVSIGTISGASTALKGNLGVIWIDIHGDINTHETSLSQNIHGMASSAILGIGDKKITDLVKTKIKKENILYIGLKDLDQAEIDLFKKHKLETITIFDILSQGFPLIIKKIQALQKKVKNIWISFDIDSIDKIDAPASAMTVSGSLTYREIINIFLYLGKTSNVVGLDIVELTPKKDIENKTGNLCIELANLAFGAHYSWYDEYMNNCKK